MKERKSPLKKKTLSSTLLTFQRIYYKHLRSRRNNKVYIALRVAEGKLVYKEYTYTVRCFFVIVQIYHFWVVLCRLVKSCRKGFNKADSMFTPLTTEAHVKQRQIGGVPDSERVERLLLHSDMASHNLPREAAHSEHHSGQIRGSSAASAALRLEPHTTQDLVLKILSDRGNWVAQFINHLPWVWIMIP